MQTGALHKSKHFFFYLVKLSISLVAVLTLFYQLNNFRAQDRELLSHLSNSSLQVLSMLIFITLGLSTLNWLLEAKKWQLAVNTTEKIHLFKALKQCLIGATSSIMTPAKVGDYIAKPLFFPVQLRTRILWLNTLNHSLQMLVTAIFGISSFLILVTLIPEIKDLLDLPFLLKALALVLAVVLMAFPIFKLKMHSSYLKLKRIMSIASTGLCARLFSLSVLRYLIFSFQFVFLLQLFGAQITLGHGFLVVSTIHLVNSMLPTPAVSDAIVKGSLGIFLFGMFGINAWMVLLVTGLMWLSNQVIPVLTGAYFLLIKKSLPPI